MEAYIPFTTCVLASSRFRILKAQCLEIPSLSDLEQTHLRRSSSDGATLISHTSGLTYEVRGGHVWFVGKLDQTLSSCLEVRPPPNCSRRKSILIVASPCPQRGVKFERSVHQPVIVGSLLDVTLTSFCPNA